MASELEEVSADEVAELERLAADAVEAGKAAKLQPPERRPLDTRLMSTHEAIDAARAAREGKPPPLRKKDRGPSCADVLGRTRLAKATVDEEADLLGLLSSQSMSVLKLLLT